MHVILKFTLHVCVCVGGGICACALALYCATLLACPHPDQYSFWDLMSLHMFTSLLLSVHVMWNLCFILSLLMNSPLAPFSSVNFCVRSLHCSFYVKHFYFSLQPVMPLLVKSEVKVQIVKIL